MSFYQIIAEKLQFVSPKFYKDRYFKKLKNSSQQNYSASNIEPELIWIKEYLQEDSVFIDIGANVGSFIYQLEQKLDPKNIIAFEPNKHLCARLKRIFNGVQIYPFAVSDQNEIAEFKIPVIKGKTFNSRGTLQIDYREKEEENHHFQKVKVIKLDDWKGLQTTTKIDFIKIDVEGNEMLTLRGAKNVIAKFRPTLMVEMEQRHHQEPLQQLISEIENWGYETYFLNRKTFELEKLSESSISESQNFIDNKETYINNMIFIPQDQKNLSI